MPTLSEILADIGTHHLKLASLYHKASEAALTVDTGPSKAPAPDHPGQRTPAELTPAELTPAELTPAELAQANGGGTGDAIVSTSTSGTFVPETAVETTPAAPPAADVQPPSFEDVRQALGAWAKANGGTTAALAKLGELGYKNCSSVPADKRAGVIAALAGKA